MEAYSPAQVQYSSATCGLQQDGRHNASLAVVVIPFVANMYAFAYQKKLEKDANMLLLLPKLTAMPKPEAFAALQHAAHKHAASRQTPV